MANMHSVCNISTKNIAYNLVWTQVWITTLLGYLMQSRSYTLRYIQEQKLYMLENISNIYSYSYIWLM